MSRSQRLQRRNEKVRTLFDKISAKNDKWRVDAVVADVAKQMYLSTRTVEAILKGEGIYGDEANGDPDQMNFAF
ncbi:MAG: hypothetical protein WA775_02960 [Psychroserpens sp.]|uniref:hypothetical protein n=1 Tax=Psychroserpens sp. TaxID=2020870 RepID=UPI003CB117A0